MDSEPWSSKRNFPPYWHQPVRDTHDNPSAKHKRIITMNNPDLNIAVVILAVVVMTGDAILLAASQSLILIQRKNHFDDLDFIWGGITIVVMSCSIALDSLNG
jgi:hypothetical protein